MNYSSNNNGLRRFINIKVNCVGKYIRVGDQ